MIHISELSSKWVKDVRDCVKVGERVVAQILRIDTTSGHIDLSIKRLSEELVRQKKREWKNEQKALKLVEFAAKRLKKKDEIPHVISKVEEEYGLVYEALDASVEGGAEIFASAGLDKAWSAELAKVAAENIKKKEISIMGFVELSSAKPEGLEDIKKALQIIEKEGGDVQYVGSPKYRIKVVSKDYKSAEKKLKEMADKAIESVRKAGGQGAFYRERQ